MSSRERAKRWERRCRLRTEALEMRDLLSIIPYLVGHPPVVSTSALALQAETGGSTGGSNASGGGTSPATGQPTPQELRRETYVAKVAGDYVTGPGRLTNQALQGFVNAEGTSNQSLRVFMQMRFFVPTDPTQPVTGVVSITLKNTSTTGNQLVLDLTASPQSGSSQLPTHFTWTVDSASGGAYINVDGFGTGQGTLDIRYAPGGKRPPRTFSSGRAYVFVNGLINTVGGFTTINVLGSRT